MVNKAAAGLGLGVLLAATFVAPVQGQGKMGTYSGVVKIRSTDQSLRNPDDKITYVAEVKLVAPITDGEVGGSTMSTIGDVDKPSAVATVTEFEASGSAVDAGGKYTFSCKLAAPATVPLIAQGVINVDFRKKTHSMFVAATGTKPLALTCKNSRSGASRDSRAFGVVFGTNDPGVIPYVELPVADPAKLVAKHRMVPTSKGRKVEIDQEWSFTLQK